MNKVQIVGVGISNLHFMEMVEHFNKVIETQQKIRVCVTPVNCLITAYRQPALKEIYNSADMVLCDGVPIVWASRFLKTPIKERITGLDVLPLYMKECASRNYTMFFLGAKEGVGKELQRKISRAYPGIKIVGVYAPPFAERFSEEETTKMVDLVNQVKPNVLWVSLTAPKQDIWIYENIHRLQTNIAIGIGGAFEVTAGIIPRAPKWMQQSGLEWFYRFLQEPKRMFHRYFIEAPVFIPLVIRQKFRF